MQQKSKYRSLSTAGLLLATTAFGVLPAGAASHCKGMAENSCANDTACTWVQSYVRKDGREVRGHCKLARGKQSVNLSANLTPKASGD
jgi:hypothetical protein